MNYKSLMFVPATQKMLSKISDFNSHAYIIDLEDSIAEDDKENALHRVINFLNSYKINNNILVRINYENIETELKMLAHYKIGFVLPKVTNVDFFERYKTVLFSHHVIALIENPLAIVNIEKIASHPIVDSLAFGAEDYTASMNMENVESNLIYPRSVICTYAKAFNKQAFDTPSFKINDYDLFKCEVDNAVKMGFDGKMLIHPKHIEYINKAFNNIDLELMKKIVDLYESRAEPVLKYENNVYEKMHIKRMKKILKENKKQWN